MSFLRFTLQCLFGPRLYRVYGTSNTFTENRLENWGNTAIRTIQISFSFGLYAVPMAAVLAWYRGTVLESFKFYSTWVLYASCILVCGYMCRAAGRVTNPLYMNFLKGFTETGNLEKRLEFLRKYDFDFDAWPTSFSAEPKRSRILNSELIRFNPLKSTVNKDLPSYARVPVQILGYVAAHTFALYLIYPGTLLIMQYMLKDLLQQGRNSLVEEYQGRRAKVETVERNQIDTMFVDQRSKTSRGRTLVISCEGNCGFYEIGIAMTAIKAGYSVLGWNHPGFYHSTGSPYPVPEQNAIDAVIQYSIQNLGFTVDNIVLFGWSIGGYAAAYGAVSYPDIKCLVLDGTFDELLPLAKNVMPPSWLYLVKEVVRGYYNLNVGDQVLKYSGPIRVIRRTEDEVIALDKSRLVTNCGNYLVVKLIMQRHPEMNSTPLINKLGQLIGLDEGERKNLEKITADNDTKASLGMIHKYVRDYKASHCEPLPHTYLIDALEQN